MTGKVGKNKSKRFVPGKSRGTGAVRSGRTIWADIDPELSEADQHRRFWELVREFLKK